MRVIIDGFRLDAMPHLYTCGGANCENLPATPAFLRRVRKEIDAMCPDTVLPAEAGQWPEDVVDRGVHRFRLSRVAPRTRRGR